MNTPRSTGRQRAQSIEFSLPSRALLERQSLRLTEVRTRLLRRSQIATRRRILDLGCGYGAVTPELVRRGGGRVIALDRQRAGLTEASAAFKGAARVCGDANRLPFAPAAFDLVFAQFAFLWMDAATALGEIDRVLALDGVLVAIEPDYGGMIEFPDSLRTQPLWISGLQRAGADPYVGRKLPSRLAAFGFNVRVELVPEIDPVPQAHMELLEGLPLSADERAELERIRCAESDLMPQAWSCIVHLPLFLITASRQ